MLTTVHAKRPARDESSREQPAAAGTLPSAPDCPISNSNNSMAVALEPPSASRALAASDSSGRGDEELRCSGVGGHLRYHQQQSQQQLQLEAVASPTSCVSVRDSLGDIAALEAFLDEWDDQAVCDQRDADVTDDTSVSAEQDIRHATYRVVNDQEDFVLSGAVTGTRSRTAKSLRGPLQRSTGSSTPMAFTSTRDRRRHEIAVLKKQEQELQELIEQFQARATSVVTSGVMTATTPTRGSYLTSESASSPLASLWRGVGERQRERRTASESENARLKAVLREQKKMARSLHRILLKRAALVTVCN